MAHFDNDGDDEGIYHTSFEPKIVTASKEQLKFPDVLFLKFDMQTDLELDVAERRIRRLNRGQAKTGRKMAGQVQGSGYLM